MPPHLEDLADTSIQILAELIDPKSHDFPARPLQLDVTPDVISASGTVRIAVKLVSVDLDVDFETGLTLPDEGKIEPATQHRVLRLRLHSFGLEGLEKDLFPGRFVWMPGGLEGVDCV